MKTIVIILKGMLLYSTMVYWLLIISTAESLMDNSITIFIIAYAVGIGLIFICKITITDEDLKKLSIGKYRSLK